MSWLVKFFELLGVSLCTVITPQAVPDDTHPLNPNGTVIAHLTLNDLSFKHVVLQSAHPTDKFFASRAAVAPPELDYSKGIVPFYLSPSAHYFDPGIPVLDQGQYGTCVTFATTAALDMLLAQGDAISQQCTLELTSALGNNFWNGALYSSQIILPLQQFGVVSQGNCGDDNYPSPNAKIDLAAYNKLTDPSLAISQVQFTYSVPMPLSTVKARIDLGFPVTIGFGLMANRNPISVQGFDILIGSVRASGGLWACKQPSSKSNWCGSPTAGHEVVIVGYDDTQQLLQIRNSWGANVADQGDFYMTYTFFGQMVSDGTEIWQ